MVTRTVPVGQFRPNTLPQHVEASLGMNQYSMEQVWKDRELTLWGRSFEKVENANFDPSKDQKWPNLPYTIIEYNEFGEKSPGTLSKNVDYPEKLWKWLASAENTCTDSTTWRQSYCRRLEVEYGISHTKASGFYMLYVKKDPLPHLGRRIGKRDAPVEVQAPTEPDDPAMSI